MNAIYPAGLSMALSLVGYNALLTGLIAFFRRRDKVGTSYFAASFAISLWGVSLAFMLNNDLSDPTAEFWGRFSQMAALWIPATWLHFVLNYTDQTSKYRPILVAVYAATVFLFPYTLTDNYVAGFKYIVEVRRYPVPASAYFAFTLLFITVVFFSFYLFWRAANRADTLQKKRDCRLMAWVSLYGFITGSLSFLPVYDIPLPQYNLLIMPLWQILLAYVMTKHKLFDLEQIAEAAQADKLAAISTIAASVNHEIRSPLYFIKGSAEGYLDKLAEGLYSDPQECLDKAKETLRKVADQAGRAMDIIKRFAIFARAEAGAEPVAGKVDIAGTVDTIFPLIRHELSLDKITLKKDVACGISHPRLDPRHFEQILFNLVMNACQAIKERGGSITVSAAQQNGSVHVSVTDDGPGIPEDRLKQIFQPFYTTKAEGTGLGLYITKQLVEKNGGKISVKSRPGVGTTFVMEFGE